MGREGGERRDLGRASLRRRRVAGSTIFAKTVTITEIFIDTSTLKN